MIGNPKRHAVVKSLSLAEQNLLSYIFEKDKTEQELEKIYNSDHSLSCKRNNKIINKIKEIIQTDNFLDFLKKHAPSVDFYESKSQDGRCDGKGGLSIKTIKMLSFIIKFVLD